MADKRTLKFLVALQTAEFKKGLDAVKRQLGQFKNYLAGAFAVGGFTAFGKGMIQAGRDFEDAMARVKAVSNASVNDFKAMEQEALKLGKTTIYSATEAAGALENLTRNGMTAKQATKALSGVLQLAQANAIGLAEAADIVTNTLNMFGLSVNQVSRVNDVLSTTASHTATNVSLLYDALVNAAPVAKVIGYNLEEVSAMLGALAQKGVKGAEAGTQLRMALVKMSDPLIVAKLQEMGVAIDENTMKANDLKYVIGTLKDAGLSFGDLVHAFSQKGAAGIQQMINSYDEFLKVLGHTQNATGEAKRMFEEGVGSVRKEFDLLKNQYNNLLINISKQTSGVIKTCVRGLQVLVYNMGNTTTALMNIGAVLLPLITNKVLKLFKQIKTLTAQAKTDALALKVAMGNWISILISVITLVGTQLFGAWKKAAEGAKELNKSIAETRNNIAELTTKANTLIKEIGPDTDKQSLAGIVAKLCEMFPDFAEEIQFAADTASKTEGYEKLKKVLGDIIELQTAMMSINTNQKIIDYNAEKIGSRLSRKKVYSEGESYDNVFSKNIKKGLQDKYGKKVASEMEDYVFQAIGKIIGENGGINSTSGKKINEYLKSVGVDLNAMPIENNIYDRSASLSGYFGYKGEKGASPLYDRRREWGDTQASTINDFSNAIKTATENIQNIQKGVADKEERVKQLKLDKIREEEKAAELQRQAAEKAAAEEEARKAAEDAANKPKENLKEVITDYENQVKELENQYNAGSISEKEYKKQLDEIEDKTWQAITALKDFKAVLNEIGKTGTGEDIEAKFNENRANEKKAQKEQLDKTYAIPTKDNRNIEYDYSKTDSDKAQEIVKIELDYQQSLEKLITDLEDALNSGDYNLVKDDAVSQLEKLKSVLEQTTQGAIKLEHAMNLSTAIEKMDKQIEQLKEDMGSTITNLAQGFERTYNAIVDMTEAFGGTIDDDTKEQWQSFFSVINGGIQLFETFKTILEAFQLIESIITKKKELDAAKQVAANIAVAKSEEVKAAAETASAAAGAGSAVAGIPFLGPALAVAAIATVIAAIMAATSKSKKNYANGGIVGGHSYTGDKINAGLNSGEMVLNKNQQATLWNLVNGKGGVGSGGNVNFEIKGDKLVGVLNNYSKKIKG